MSISVKRRGRLPRDPENFQKDRDVMAFIKGHPDVFTIEPTDIGQRERERRAAGGKPKPNAGEVAIADFMSDGLEKYVAEGKPVAILFEDSDVARVRFFRKPDNLHLLSTVGMLRGLERVGVIPSADAIIHDMTHPPDPRRARASPSCRTGPTMRPRSGARGLRGASRALRRGRHNPERTSDP